MKLDVDLVDLVMAEYARKDDSEEMIECKKQLRILHKSIVRRLKTNSDLIEKYLKYFMEMMTI